jgi:hypothetical protein
MSSGCSIILDLTNRGGGSTARGATSAIRAAIVATGAGTACTRRGLVTANLSVLGDDKFADTRVFSEAKCGKHVGDDAGAVDNAVIGFSVGETSARSGWGTVNMVDHELNLIGECRINVIGSVAIVSVRGELSNVTTERMTLLLGLGLHSAAMDAPLVFHSTSNLVEVERDREDVVRVHVANLLQQVGMHHRLVTRMGVVDHKANQVAIVNDIANDAFIKGVLFDAKDVWCKTFISALLGLVAWDTVVIEARVFLTHKSIQCLVTVGDTSDDCKGRALFDKDVLTVDSSMDSDAH